MEAVLRNPAFHGDVTNVRLLNVWAIGDYRLNNGASDGRVSTVMADPNFIMAIQNRFYGAGRLEQSALVNA